MGGEMREEGKPYPGVYRHCLELLVDRPGTRVLCVGDGLQTDILGAHKAGLDALWVTGGLPAHDWGLQPHDMPDAHLIDEACHRAGLRPVAAVPLLRW
jgi:ribonucleotide monophosphatase NagD (HAD superfamily)